MATAWSSSAAFRRRPRCILIGCARRPPQYFYDVITNGHGVMYSFADRVSADDRWAIAAYIRALQRSQNVHRWRTCRAAEREALP